MHATTSALTPSEGVSGSKHLRPLTNSPLLSRESRQHNSSTVTLVLDEQKVQQETTMLTDALQSSHQANEHIEVTFVAQPRDMGTLETSSTSVTLMMENPTIQATSAKGAVTESPTTAKVDNLGKKK